MWYLQLLKLALLLNKKMKHLNSFLRILIMILPAVVVVIVFSSQTPIVNSGTAITLKNNCKIPYAPGLPSRANISIVKGIALLGGDIDLGDSAQIERFQFMQASTVIRDENYRWPNGIVPYEFGPDFSDLERRALVDAMNHIINRTNVLFRLRTTEDNFIRFTRVTEAELGFRGGSAVLGFTNRE
jgi:hypothetical protein